MNYFYAHCPLIKWNPSLVTWWTSAHGYLKGELTLISSKSVSFPTCQASSSFSYQFCIRGPLSQLQASNHTTHVWLTATLPLTFLYWSQGEQFHHHCPLFLPCKYHLSTAWPELTLYQYAPTYRLAPFNILSHCVKKRSFLWTYFATKSLLLGTPSGSFLLPVICCTYTGNNLFSIHWLQTTCKSNIICKLKYYCLYIP